MNMLLSKRFLPLFVTQFIGAFCDNVFKNAFVLLTTFGLAVQHGWNPAYAVQLIAGLFILPFVLVSGWAGYVSDIWPRHTLVRALKTFEAFVMLAAALALYENSFYGMWAIIVALGFISAMFGPLKYGLLPVYLSTDELVSGNAWFEAGSFIAIVTGTLVGARAAMGGPGRNEVGLLLVVLGVIGCISTYFLPKAPASARRTISPWSPRSLRLCAADALGSIRRVPTLWRSVLGISWFWCLGAVLLSFLPNYVKENLHQDATGVTHFLLFFAIGVGVGSFMGLFLNRGRISATYVPLAGLAMSAFLFMWIVADRVGGPHMGLYLTIVTAGIGVAGGVYSVPLYAIMQHKSPVDQRGRVISANNIMNAVFMVGGAIGAIIVAAIDPRPAALLFVLAVCNLAASFYMIWLLPESVLHTIVRLTLKVVFRVEVRGIENLPASGPRLVIANHTSWLDAALLAAFLPEPPIFAVDSRIAEIPWVKPFLTWTTAYALDPTRPISLKTLCGIVEKGGLVAIFPEGRLTTTGGLMKVYDGAGFIAQRAGAQVIPVHIDGAQLSPFTRLGTKYRRYWFPKITLTVGAAQTMPEGLGRKARSPFVSRILAENACAALTPAHSMYRELLAAAGKHRGAKPTWMDHTGQSLSYGQILGRSAYLGTRLAALTKPGEPVGIMMPTSIGGALAFWGLQFAHRVPAWLNFSMGSAAFASTVKTTGIRSVVTSRAFITAGRLEEKARILAESGVGLIYLEDLKPGFGWKLRAAWMGLNPSGSYTSHEKRWIKLGRDPRSSIFFTSGSSGLPKAVVLSHANLLANVAQLRATIDFSHNDCVFNALPLFHAFGFTGGMLTPLLSGVRTVLYPTPLHYGIIPEFIYSTNATIFFATNSFLNGYARKANAYDFYSLRYVFAGAEKLQPATQKLWNERFGIRVFEGYGTTEASPALAINTPLAFKPGTVGCFLPGVRYKLDPVPGTEGGRLHFSGPNRMMGYYLPENPGVLAESGEWYDTGDIVAVDEQGFVSILGRAKRFAKIAGEMVSLSSVEEAISSACTGMAAVVSRPHPTKGEELVIVTSDKALTAEAVREAVRAKGLSDLSIPRQIRVCVPFPLLGSGKPDLVALQQVAEAVAA
ncbi:MAG TPA: MFS transporter [Opitutaceae bacterium]|jgi:acyl-[acyl-carrier-protein]-phospholipid O-acyltransferase/long-chain-fatty-acid--[acyl-carrier-protein] ligase|nr:MFS transporter [Opitutaceae bacterium]